MKTKITAALAAVALAFAAIVFLRPPAYADARFHAVSGEQFSLAELRGRVVLVNFWATYCASCLREMPQLVQTHETFAARGYETVAVAVRRDQRERVEQFARALPFRVALDDSGDIAERFGRVRLTPTTFVIDRQGRVIKRYVGEPDWAEVHRLVERALSS